MIPVARLGVTSPPLSVAVVIAGVETPMSVLSLSAVTPAPVFKLGLEPSEVIADTGSATLVLIAVWVAVTAPVTLGNVALTVALISLRCSSACDSASVAAGLAASRLSM